VHILTAMTDDPADLPIKEYIARGATEGALAAAQRLAETIGVTLNDVLRAIQEVAPPSATGSASLPGIGTMTARADVIVHGEAGEISVSAPLGDVGQGADDLRVVRRADVDELGKSWADLATLSLRSRLLLTVVLIAAVYPVLPPEVQKYLLEDVGLAAAFAQIFSLLQL
jgi:hypothetical protein